MRLGGGLLRERAQKLSAEQLTFIEDFPGAVAVADAEWKVEAANKEYFRLFRLETVTEEAVDCLSHLHPQDRDALLSAAAREPHAPFSLDVRLSAGIDGYGLVRLHVRRQRDSEHWIISAIDIEEVGRLKTTLQAETQAKNLEHVVTRSLMDQESGDIVGAFLEALCRDTWALAMAWKVDTESGLLVFADYRSQGEPTQARERLIAHSRQFPFAKGAGLPGCVWERSECVWYETLDTENGSIRDMKVSDAGFRSCAALPVRGADAVVGVVELFAERHIHREPAVERSLMNAAQLMMAAAAHKSRVSVLKAREEHFRSVTERSRDAVVTIDSGSRIVTVNQATEKLFGYSKVELLGHPLTQLMPENMRAAHTEGFRRYLESGRRRMQWDAMTVPAIAKDGREIQLEISLAELRQGEERFFTGVIRDVTEMKKEQSAMFHQALHDALTGLPNRALLQERLNRAVLVAQRHHQALSLLFMDLDHFKQVNDTLGHNRGDRLLIQVSERLSRTLRESDTVARSGGDEFLLLLPATDRIGAVQTSVRVREALEEPFLLDGHSLPVRASIGIAVFPEHGDNGTELMQRADAAMYRAKREVKGYFVYSPDIDKEEDSPPPPFSGESQDSPGIAHRVLPFQPKADLAT